MTAATVLLVIACIVVLSLVAAFGLGWRPGRHAGHCAAGPVRPARMDSHNRGHVLRGPGVGPGAVKAACGAVAGGIGG
jgi:hypothetical protein